MNEDFLSFKMPDHAVSIAKELKKRLSFILALIKINFPGDVINKEKLVEELIGSKPKFAADILAATLVAIMIK